MSIMYKLHITNNSTQFGSFCVYTTCLDGTSSDNFLSLAWFSKNAHPDTSLSFSWDVDYSFVWSQTGLLAPGIKFIASQSMSADPFNVSKNTAYLDRIYGEYLFNSDLHERTTPAGQIGVFQSDKVLSNDTSVGIGIGGKAALVKNSQPNMLYKFTPKIKYWLCFGKYTQGEVLDLEAISDVIPVEFPPGVHDISLTFDKSNQFIQNRAN